MFRYVALGLTAIAAVPVAGGCDSLAKPSASGGTTPSASASASASAKASAGASSSASASSAASAAPEPYKGPSGTLSGMIRVTGDPPPDTPHEYPKACRGEAGAMYGKLFRVGQDHALADAIVAVTKYEGYVAPKSDAVHVTVRSCAYSTRSIAISDGQRIEVRNVEDDTTTYLPWLDGARAPAGIVATPRGDAVKLYSRGYGRYWLRDQMGRTFMVAHVFHFHFSTTSVTGLDGQYRIEGVPVGTVGVSAMLPQANLLSVTKPLEIKEGDNKLDLELKFDKKRDVPEVSEAALPDEKRK